MSFELPELPYAKDALTPHISAETLEVHHGKHHAKYVKTLNDLVQGSEWEGKSLEEIVRRSDGKLFNQAGQHWNHSFYWNCMSPKGGGDPSGTLADALKKHFGGFDDFRRQFDDVAKSVFGSGWAWLVRRSDGSLAIEQTPNAENPLLQAGETPLLTCDMWEHAYYIDYRNAKAEYLKAFWNVVHWDFVARNL